MTFTENNLKLFSMTDLAFSRWLNGEMERLGLTQEALGNKVGVSHVTVSKWQRGKHLPDPRTLRKLAGVAGANDVWLFRLVGYLGAASKDDAESRHVVEPDIERLIDKLMQLPVDERTELGAIVDVKLKRQKRGRE